MERKIGETFEYDGVKLRVEKETCICKGCFFEGSFKCKESAQERGECQSASRSNGGVIFVKVEDMETRSTRLSLEKAKGFYAKGGEFRDLALSAFTEEELTKKELPKTWEEYMNFNIDGTFSSVTLIMRNQTDLEAHLSMVKLHHLRDCYRQGWVPNWNDGTIKHCIKSKGRDVYLYTSQQTNQFLSFQAKDVADEFINNFSDLIRQAADLI